MQENHNMWGKPVRAAGTGTRCSSRHALPPTFMNVHISLTQLLGKMELAEVKIKVIPEIAE